MLWMLHFTNVYHDQECRLPYRQPQRSCRGTTLCLQPRFWATACKIAEEEAPEDERGSFHTAPGKSLWSGSGSVPTWNAFIPRRAAHYPLGSAAAQISWLCDTKGKKKIYILKWRVFFNYYCYIWALKLMFLLLKDSTLEFSLLLPKTFHFPYMNQRIRVFSSFFVTESL